MRRDYEAVIGLEAHAELKTESKIFCSCNTEFGGEPNTHVCPVCLGLPGVLPVINKKVVDYAIKTALALNCQVAAFSKFDRKNYYYPDLPKNFQTSQYDLPIAQHGKLEVEVDGQLREIGITRIHMEEDAGKLVHQGGATIGESQYSLVDLNRAGVPLIEIVSEPDMRTPDEARAYMEKLKAILEYTDVSDCKMQEGSLRCDANVSVRPRGSQQLGTKAEVKNMNSFRSLQRAVAYEIERQIDLIEEGGSVIQETRSWDEVKGITVSMRSKEEANDYRYLPEPDLVPLVIDEAWIQDIRRTLPELPDERRKRLTEIFGLPEYDAMVITNSKALAEYFDSCLEDYDNAKAISNWIMGELLRLLNAGNLEVEQSPVQPRELVELQRLVDKGIISGKIAKDVFEEMFETGQKAEAIVKARGLEQISDEGELEAMVIQVIEANPRSIEDYKSGKEQALGYLVGQIMKATRGKANPQLVNKLLREKLSGI